jgi:hypothetical protein
MSIATAKNHMAEMNMLGMLALLSKTLAEATRDKIRFWYDACANANEAPPPTLPDTRPLNLADGVIEIAMQ